MLKTAVAGALVLGGLACLACGAGALATVSVGAAHAGPPTLPIPAADASPAAAGSTPSAATSTTPAPAGTTPAAAGIPPAMLLLYQKATATQCPEMPWQILAAIGDVESGNGTSDLPGARSGANYAGAEDIWKWDRAFRYVRDRGLRLRACGVSTMCEARAVAGGRHTSSIWCRPYGDRVSGVAGGVPE